jgi:hypothetical protein
LNNVTIGARVSRNRGASWVSVGGQGYPPPGCFLQRARGSMKTQELTLEHLPKSAKSAPKSAEPAENKGFLFWKHCAGWRGAGRVDLARTSSLDLHGLQAPSGEPPKREYKQYNMGVNMFTDEYSNARGCCSNAPVLANVRYRAALRYGISLAVAPGGPWDGEPDGYRAEC